MSSRVRGYASRDSSPNALPMSEGARHGEPVGLHDLEKSHALREEGTTVTLPVDVSGGGHRMRARVLARLATRGIYLVRGVPRSLPAGRTCARREREHHARLGARASIARVCGANVDSTMGGHVAGVRPWRTRLSTESDRGHGRRASRTGRSTAEGHGARRSAEDQKPFPGLVSRFRTRQGVNSHV